ncbi:MAG: alpha/beta fold hydrolase [Gemmatimonadales bacterium]
MGKGVINRLVLALLTLAACRAEPIRADQRFPAGTPYEAKYVTVDGTRIRYIEGGGASERGTVILLHGLGASMYSWRHSLGPVAAAGFRVVAFDNRGFGFSERPRAGYTNADYARLLVALMDSLGVREAVLAGHSMGGAIAAEVALAHPERVRGLVLVGAAGYGARAPFQLRLARWPVVGGLAVALRGRGSTARVLRAMYADPAKVTERDIDQYYAPVATDDYGRALRGALRQFRCDTLRGRLGTLEIPTLALWGERDRVVPVALGRALATELLRVAFVVVPGAGHAVHEEAPEEVNRLLIAFLTDGLPRTPENLAGLSP